MMWSALTVPAIENLPSRPWIEVLPSFDDALIRPPLLAVPLIIGMRSMSTAIVEPLRFSIAIVPRDSTMPVFWQFEVISSYFTSNVPATASALSARATDGASASVSRATVVRVLRIWFPLSTGKAVARFTFGPPPRQPLDSLPGGM